MPKSDDVPIKREKKKIIKKRENDHETEREREEERVVTMSSLNFFQKIISFDVMFVCILRMVGGDSKI